MLWHNSIFLSVLTIVDILLTIVTFFWCIYLIDAIKRKSACYKSNLRCQQGQVDSRNPSLAYIEKTDLVKYQFLFYLNITEWLGYTLATIISYISTADSYHHPKHTNDTNTTHTAFPLVHLPLLDNGIQTIRTGYRMPHMTHSCKHNHSNQCQVFD